MSSKIFHPALFAFLLIGLGCGCGSSDGTNSSADFTAGLMPKELDGKYGYVDSLGNTIIEPQFDYAYPFSEGRALIKIGEDPHGKYGYIDPSGNLAIPAIYDRANDFSEGLASVGTGDANGMMVFHNGFIDPLGQVVIPLTYYQVGDFHEGLALYAEDHNNTEVWGFIDKSGKVRIPAEFDTYSTCGFRKGLAPVRLRNDGDEMWGFLDKTGALVIPFQYGLSETKDSWAVKKTDGQELAVQMGSDGSIVFMNENGEAVKEEYLEGEYEFSEEETDEGSDEASAQESERGSIGDSEGNTYATVRIGKQEWMAENLRSTKYQNGDAVPYVGDAAQWVELLSGAWTTYKNDPLNAAPHGMLYNWYVVSDRRNVCPAGWHVPSDGDWTQLTTSLGGTADGYTPDEFKGAGGKMKTAGTEYWKAPNTGATNESGFAGRASGSRYWMDGRFVDIGITGSWWSTTRNDEHNSWGRDLNHNSASLRRNYHAMSTGLSVRCVKD